jgi:hypothetical protein
MSKRYVTVFKDATVEGHELVVSRPTGETRIDLPALLTWIADHRPDLLNPYLKPKVTT